MGYVYALINPCFKTHENYYWVKIGMTRTDPWARAKELFTTGLPTPFQVAWYKQCDDPEWYEKRIHTFLEKLRFTKKREFFTMREDFPEKLDELMSDLEEQHDSERMLSIGSHGFADLFETFFSKLED